MARAWEMQGDYRMDLIEQRRPLLGWTFTPRERRSRAWEAAEKFYGLLVYFILISAIYAFLGLIEVLWRQAGWLGIGAYGALVLLFTAVNYFKIADFMSKIKDNAIVRDDTVRWWWFRVSYPVVVRCLVTDEGKLRVNWLVSRQRARILDKSRHDERPASVEGLDERPLVEGSLCLGDQGVGLHLTRPPGDGTLIHIHLRGQGPKGQHALTLEVDAAGWLPQQERAGLPVLQGRGVEITPEDQGKVLRELLPMAQALGASLPPGVARALAQVEASIDVPVLAGRRWRPPTLWVAENVGPFIHHSYQI